MFKNCLNVIAAERDRRIEMKTRKLFSVLKTFLRGKYGSLCEGKRVIVVTFDRPEVVYSTTGEHATRKQKNLKTFTRYRKFRRRRRHRRLFIDKHSFFIGPFEFVSKPVDFCHRRGYEPRRNPTNFTRKPR